MNPVRFLGDALQTAVKSLPFLWRQQGEERRRLIADLQTICSRCDDAYAMVLARLRPVKDSLEDPEALPIALRDFHADQETRAAFKPEHLCGEVDQLLQRLASNADWMKYSVDLRNIDRLRGAISSMGSYDGQLRDYYDDHTRAMDDLAAQLQAAATQDELAERLAYATHIVTEFESDLDTTLTQIRRAKDHIRALI